MVVIVLLYRTDRFSTQSPLSRSRFFPHAFSLLSNINTAKSLLLQHIKRGRNPFSRRCDLQLSWSGTLGVPPPTFTNRREGSIHSSPIHCHRHLHPPIVMPPLSPIARVATIKQIKGAGGGSSKRPGQLAIAASERFDQSFCTVRVSDYVRAMQK